ncbi:hypothetical protein ACEQPO_18175 [Bacillus sp. SL00103]
MKLKLSSPQVGIKINEWYRQICGFHVMKAEKLKGRDRAGNSGDGARSKLLCCFTS